MNFLHNFSVPYSTFFFIVFKYKKKLRTSSFFFSNNFLFLFVYGVRLYRARQYNECAINVLVVPSHKFNCTRKKKSFLYKKSGKKEDFRNVGCCQRRTVPKDAHGHQNLRKSSLSSKMFFFYVSRTSSVCFQCKKRVLHSTFLFCMQSYKYKMK